MFIHSVCVRFYKDTGTKTIRECRALVSLFILPRPIFTRMSDDELYEIILRILRELGLIP